MAVQLEGYKDPKLSERIFYKYGSGFSIKPNSPDGIQFGEQKEINLGQVAGIKVEDVGYGVRATIDFEGKEKIVAGGRLITSARWQRDVDVVGMENRLTPFIIKINDASILGKESVIEELPPGFYRAVWTPNLINTVKE